MAREENKMGYMPVKKLIIEMSLPMVISMMVQALYNVVDSLFVARISEAALTAVTLAFPMQSLLIAIASGTSVGVNALLSRSLGERHYERANKAANMALFLTAINAVVFVIIGLTAVRPFVLSQTTDAGIAADCITYLSIVLICSFGVLSQIMLERLLQSTGRTNLSMISQVCGAVFNIIMDPILIFGLGPFPAMGVAGAAIATVMGQCLGAAIAFILNIKKNKDITLSLASVLKPDGSIIKRIYFVGVPSILTMSIGSIMTYSMNHILIAFSTTATAVFGVYFRLQSFFFMPVFGLNNGVVPVLAFNYGAQNKQRIKESLRFSVGLAVIIMTIGMIVFQLFPRQLLGMFNASEDMMALGVRALRVISISFPCSAIAIGLASVYQAFSRSYYSLILSVMRQLVVLIPAAWLLARTGVVENVWWAFTIAETFAAVSSLLIYRRVKRTVIDPIPDEPPQLAGE